MKSPTVASLKKVTAENLAVLGAERLAELLVAVAQSRPELKRRLRMELAAEQGSEHLVVEIDKRLASLETSRAKVSWRQRAGFVRDLDGVRGLIAGRLADLDRPLALDRLFRLLAAARRIGARVRDRDGALAEVFSRAASDIGGLSREDDRAAERLAEAITASPGVWADWLPLVLQHAPPGVAAGALRAISLQSSLSPGAVALVRQLADAAGEVDAYRATFTAAALRTPSVAAEVADRLLAADRVAEAGEVLVAAVPQAGTASKRQSKGVTPPAPDFDWETAWIAFLDRSGDGEAAQAARWTSFERTLSAERAKAFARQLPDFEDVEAETRAFAFAAGHPDAERALDFLMAWPALPEAARLIAARASELGASAEEAEAWASALRQRYPDAAHTLLRRAAAVAFQRRAFATCDRLTHEADTIEV